ncbi:uncharacterized protein LOC129946698 [Eupeodes corollae]|uniref:uncharacterized protein LOC129946698 n=1 Tax=Eupeodes corollae TaxID=290404 RepID=UPI0024922853|nr:uncharacterized protein LOC129946698 [Eupeodes corollae]
MKTWALCVCVLLISANYSNALSTLRKQVKQADKVVQLKQLDLPEAEIDPNIGPTLPNAEGIVAETAEAAEAAEAVETAAEEIAEKPVASAASTAEEEVAAVAEETVDAVEAVSSSPALTEESNPVNEDDPNQLSKYCKCSDTHCDCCRNFQLPILPVRGPGCAKVTYLGNERMSVSIKYGDLVLATRTISGKKAKPICVSLPGGFSKFCGRVYGLSKGKEDFKACLGLELRSEEEVEASMRVSCFKFGAKGLQVAEAEPLPEVPKEEEEDEDDIFGFAAGGGSDDDYDEEDEEEDDDDAEDDDDDAAGAGAAATDDADYDGFSFLGSGLLDDLDDSEEASSPVQATRNDRNAIAQSKEGEGIPLVEAETGAVEQSTNTTADATKPDGTKVKKNKKKKKKASDSYFALDFLNGILDFFN